MKTLTYIIIGSLFLVGCGVAEFDSPINPSKNAQKESEKKGDEPVGTFKCALVENQSVHTRTIFTSVIHGPDLVQTTTLRNSGPNALPNYVVGMANGVQSNGLLLGLSGPNYDTNWSFSGSPNSSFGAYHTGLGDLNADGFEDFASSSYDSLTSPNTLNGHVELRSGKTGTPLKTAPLSYFSRVSPTPAQNYFGVRLTAGFFDGPAGIEILAFDRTGGHFFNNIPNNPTETHSISSDSMDLFTRSPAVIGDFDGDRSDDFVLGGPHTKTAALISGRTGLVLRSHSFPNDVNFGFLCKSIGDFNLDGFKDYACSDTGVLNVRFVDKGRRGKIRIFSGDPTVSENDSLITTIEIGDPNDGKFGYDFDMIPDIDHDGRPDFIIGAFAASEGTATKPVHFVGAISIFASSKNAIVGRFRGSHEGSRYGESIHTLNHHPDGTFDFVTTRLNKSFQTTLEVSTVSCAEQN